MTCSQRIKREDVHLGQGIWYGTKSGAVYLRPSWMKVKKRTGLSVDKP
jgi:hypothetical protein